MLARSISYIQCNIYKIPFFDPMRLCGGIRILLKFAFPKCFLCVSALSLPPSSDFLFTVIVGSLITQIGHRKIVLQQHPLKLTRYISIKNLNNFLAFGFQTYLLWERIATFPKKVLCKKSYRPVRYEQQA